jgi:hypothetical protein
LYFQEKKVRIKEKNELNRTIFFVHAGSAQKSAICWAKCALFIVLESYPNLTKLATAQNPFPIEKEKWHFLLEFYCDMPFVTQFHTPPGGENGQESKGPITESEV